MKSRTIAPPAPPTADGKGTFVRAAPLLLILLAAAPGRAAAQIPVSSPLKTPLPVTVFQGGIPTGTATGDAIPITVLDAIKMGLAHNLGALTAEQAVTHANGTRWRALSDLLPNVNARVSETRQTINLAAFGFGNFGDAFGNIPNIVGPFNVFDARVYVSQALLDLHARNDARAEGFNVTAAQFVSKSAREFVIHVAANLYIQALAAQARVETAKTQQQTAAALNTQAQDLKTGGLVAGIDVLRAQVELSNETQRLTAAVNDFEKTKLQLARAIGLPLGQAFTLDARLPDLPDPDLTLEAAVERAYQTRPDYQAALARVKAAEAARQAIIGESLPSIHLNADYGDLGLSPSDAHATFTVSGALIVPIFQGGKAKGRLLEADADLRTRRAEAEDQKATVYYEIRTAFLDLQASAQLLETATKGRDLAAQALTQARDRFTAGVGNNIEVVQAQDAVASANEQAIRAQYGFALAKGALIRTVGNSDEMLRQLLGGTR
jgi:outer membrane protein TolC